MTILEILSEQTVQIGIFALILIGLVLNFIVRLVLIKEGIYKKVYKQRRIDWEKFKGGVWLIGFAGLLIGSYTYSWGVWVTLLSIIAFIGVTQILSGLFLSRKSWKSHKYWD